MRIVWLALFAFTPSVASAADEVWWSLRPLSTPALPQAAAKDAAWVRTPVDAFVLAKLREKGLSPAPEADKRVLVRRLYFDLIGLPPTPAEVEAFVGDASANAYERLVEKLLASPHYGERWARHWMDVAHYAETHGHDQDRVRPFAWRYRDYLIDAFNTDRPYATFIQEQIAADVLFPERTERTPALGFLAAGPWDESSLRDIRDDSIDRQVGYYLDRDDMVTTAMSTVVSLTAHCARCHDHKFDPIAQEDYYRLQAVFAGVGRGNREYDPDPTVRRKRLGLTATLGGIDKKSPEVLARIAAPEFRRERAAWETRLAAGVRWEPLEIVAVTSEGGATMKPMADGSVRAEGKRPETDTYVVTLRTRLKGVTAVRLEVLPDDSLPFKGPGRQDNGNLHLSEFQLLRNAAKVELLPPVSDYDQPDWTIRHAVDGNPRTAWGIYPQVGRPHQAVFPVRQSFDGEFTVRLEQLHGAGHLIGRFRLTATAAPSPGIGVMPDAVTAIIATPAATRSPAQWEQLALHYLREKTQGDLAAVPPPQMVYAAAGDFMPDASHKPVAVPRPVHLLKRGDIRKPGAEVLPGSLSCVADLTSDFNLPKGHAEGERRAALARWLTDRKNPLTWRSIVNRVWHYHFGRGLVDTPNDFGKMGGRPSHPELLDWLAVRFRDSGGSIKDLHRLLVTSAVYRQSSAHNADYAKIDGENRLLWRMPRGRLDAEQVRDAILQTSERLDRRAGGPSDAQFDSRPGPHVTAIIDYGKFTWDRPEGHRRSVYRFVFRTLPDPFVDCLDGADASQLTPARNLSITAPQSLALFNNEFVLAHSAALARALMKHSPDEVKQIAEACRRIWGRAPAIEESAALRAYLKKHGLPNVCRLLLNSNEFLFLD